MTTTAITTQKIMREKRRGDGKGKCSLFIHSLVIDMVHSYSVISMKSFSFQCSTTQTHLIFKTIFIHFCKSFSALKNMLHVWLTIIKLFKFVCPKGGDDWKCKIGKERHCYEKATFVHSLSRLILLFPFQNNMRNMITFYCVCNDSLKINIYFGKKIYSYDCQENQEKETPYQVSIERETVGEGWKGKVWMFQSDAGNRIHHMPKVLLKMSSTYRL